jgi:hypothetical protein
MLTTQASKDVSYSTLLAPVSGVSWARTAQIQIRFTIQVVPEDAGVDVPLFVVMTLDCPGE